MSSCLADCTIAPVESISEEAQDKQTIQDSYGRVRRSAAMIGLAISMSATGMLLAQSKAAMAADTISANPSIATLPASSDADQVSSLSQEAPLALHKVQQGESINQLAQEYQVEPQAIANSNQISVTTALMPGQTIRIPAVEKLVAPVRQIVANAPQSEAIASKPLNTSLDHLRETRKRLKESLAELKTEKSNPHIESASNVSDVSQSLNPVEVAPQDRTVVAQNIVTEAIEIPVYPAETEKRVISSPSRSSRVKPSTTVIKSSESNLRANASSLAPSEVQESSPITSSLPELPSVPPANSQKTARADFEQPISIPVVPSQTPINSAESSAFNTSPSPQEIDVNSEPSSFREPAVIRQPRVIAPVSQKFYQIKPGDTLNSIARRHGLSSAELIRANGITNPNKIKVYQSLVIPQRGSFAQAQRTPSRLTPLGRPLSSFNTVSEGPTSRFEDNRLPQQQTNTLEISVSAAPDSYTEKLRRDMANLEQDYGQNPQSIAIEVNPDAQDNSTDTVVGESLNPEWDSDRQRQSTFAQPTRRTTRQLPSAPPQIIGTAPSDAQEYNEAFQIPVGTNVGPDLPPLSSPDNYLPNGPMQFTGYIWPTKGVLTSGYGRRWGRMHRGIDIAAPIGTPIMAAAPGEVISAGWNSGGYGNLVKIRHADGSVTLYAHNSRILVRRGQMVEQGEQISLMGSTGRSTGPHLHFEVHPGGSGAVNPIAFLPKDRGS
ncbi:peptidoglycan DD-metalloendopeptidase family protein [Aphanothece sacrum]|uniref:peptidoglycan DD-metalloendopeptidase family protein n=1 Tax=Aphanothece sacrum TaxID=1122 RepID=UPI000F6119EC